METEIFQNCYAVIIITFVFDIIILVLSFENKGSKSVLVLNLFVNKKISKAIMYN